jgi:hypothetical protein
VRAEALAFDLSHRLGDPATPLRRAHIGWLHALVSQAAAGFLEDDVNESGEHLLTVDSAKRTFFTRLTEVETGAEMARSRVDRALLGRDVRRLMVCRLSSFAAVPFGGA